jgi:mono/diheme cytochrome c family protein
MATLAFVLFWIIVGLALLFVAMSGGPKGARDRMQAQSKSSQRNSYAMFGVALLVLGFVVPGLVIHTMSSRDSIPEAGIDSLTEEEERGRFMFAQRCANCHTLEAAAAQSRVGPSLDQLRPRRALVVEAIENGRARGNGQMAADLVVGEDVEAVAAFVERASGADTGDSPPGGEPAG